MSRLLEILGSGITVDVADLMWHWLDTIITDAADASDADKPQTLWKTDEHAAQFNNLVRIIELIDKKKTDTAEQQLRLYLFDNPSCLLGRMAAAAIYISKSQMKNAIEELNAVYRQQPNNTMALYALGHCYERLGKEAEAIEFYQDCLKFKNYLHLPRQRIAAIYFKNNQLEKTIREYELLREEYPDDISTLISLGFLYIANAEYNKAADTFNTAILIHPDNFHTYDQGIDELIQEGQLHEALEHIDCAIEQEPDKAGLYLKRADILCELGAADEAVSQYRKAVSLCPDFLEATIKLGTHYLRMCEYQLAAKQFNHAVEINDQVVDAYFGLALAQKLGGDLADATATLSLAAAIQPNSSLLLAEAAALQFRASFTQNAPFEQANQPSDLIETVIAAHRQQIHTRPQNPDLHYRLGVLTMGAGQMFEAADSFRTALQINPTYARARTKLAVCLFEINRKDAAIEQLATPDCLDADTLDLHYKTALLYWDRIKFASSLINLEFSLENNFASPDATINISIVLQNLGLLDRATAMWDNLSDTTNLAIHSNHPFSPDEF